MTTSARGTGAADSFSLPVVTKAWWRCIVPAIDFVYLSADSFAWRCVQAEKLEEERQRLKQEAAKLASDTEVRDTPACCNTAPCLEQLHA
jgi:hypothetical protein